MRSSHIAGIAILVIIVGTLIVATFYRPAASAQGLSSSPARLQVTATAAADDKSVIGSTNGIVVMGFLIVLIVTTPLIFRKKKK